jgi:predicted nucleotidyltransferase
VSVSGSVVDRLTRIATAHPDVCALYLFGSLARGDATKGSDVDAGVLYLGRQSLEATLALEQELERAIGRHVDLVDVTRAGAFLALDIVRGERVFCRDRVKADLFELYVLRRAGDLLPFERLRQAALLERHP